MLGRKTLIAAMAATIAVALSPLPELGAAPFGSRGSPQPSSDLELVQAKKKAAKKKKKGKRKKAAKGTKTASCGTFKYRKGGKCLDARDKKK